MSLSNQPSLRYPRMPQHIVNHPSASRTPEGNQEEQRVNQREYSPHQKTTTNITEVTEKVNRQATTLKKGHLEDRRKESPGCVHQSCSKPANKIDCYRRYMRHLERRGLRSKVGKSTLQQGTRTDRTRNCPNPPREDLDRKSHRHSTGIYRKE